ncbi:hypothetical protein [Comamonas thiooxydans]|uniref:hypothetical protein n=1 Tax=Comamonas thiooxydans TaxID=363952 RepID=UPI001555D1F5|nr:hypothetical protein [Comamonas thiooxydans]
MSDVVYASEAAMAAETHVELLFADAHARLHRYNARLIELTVAIKQSQPVASGSVCLELYPCGSRCSGCPHPRWMKYRWTEPTPEKPSTLLAINLSAKKADPVLALARKGPGAAVTANLIREAKAILEKRSKLLSKIRSLHYGPKDE